MLAQAHILTAAALLAAAPRSGGRPDAAVPEPHPVVQGDGYEGVIFPVSPIDPAAFHADGTWVPSAADVRNLEELLVPALKAARVEPCKVDRPSGPDGQAFCRMYGRELSAELDEILGRIRTYRRQYAGFSAGGKRTILVNFFLGPTKRRKDWYPNWRSIWVSAHGGGTGYWGIFFDVQEQRFHSFHANSPR